jgi:DNA-binding NarL/FixJ family response regulator
MNRQNRGATNRRRPSLARVPAESPAKIVIVDDHPMVREGLKMRIGNEPDLLVCGEADAEAEALRIIRKELPQLVIADLSLRTGHGIDLIQRLHEEFPAIQVLVLSMHDETLYAERALRAGARGYLNKQEPQERLIEAVRTVLSGAVYLSQAMTQRMLSRVTHNQRSLDPVDALTDRELQIFQMLGAGMTTRRIAEALNRSVHTIETHREKIKRRLNLRTANDLVQCAIHWVIEHDG